MLNSIKKNEQYRDELLEAWEETYKKGQLTLWVFIALNGGEKIVDEIKEFITVKTNNTISCEEQSLYRMLRKYYELKMVDYRTGPGNGGPDRKYYFLTSLGKELLRLFTTRNIMLFYEPEIKNLMFNK